jgi:type IV pilus assembly protein PilN
MAVKVLGIEIDERLIKVVETNMGPGARKVLGCFMFQTPQNAVADGEIKNAESVAAALKEQLSRNGFRNKKVVFTVSSGRVATREVVVPPVKDSRLKTIIESNASDYFPVDMSKYHITYTLQEKKTSGENAGARLLVMAAPIAILEGYFKLADLLGFQILAIDYSGNSQFRLMEAAPADGVTMYVDISGTYSITTIMKKSKLMLQRTFSSGVDDHVLAYMSSMNRGEGEYLTALKEVSSDYYIPAYGEGAAPVDRYEYLSRLLGNITRIADYFNSSNWETPIERLVLTGVGATVAGLREAVEESTGLTVSVMSKLEKVSAPTSVSNHLPMYISCLGSAIAPVDFIPEQFSKAKKREAKKKKETVTAGVIIMVGCIAVAGALSATTLMNYYSVLDEKSKMEKEIARLEYAETVYGNAKLYNEFSLDMTALQDLVKSPNSELRAFLEELETKMPSEVNILSASCTETDINMNIEVSSKEAAAKTIAQLRTFDSIGSIEVGPLAEEIDESGFVTVSFNVSCSYRVEPAAPEPAPAAQGAEAEAAAGPQE